MTFRDRILEVLPSWGNAQVYRSELADELTKIALAAFREGQESMRERCANRSGSTGDCLRAMVPIVDEEPTP